MADTGVNGNLCGYRVSVLSPPWKNRRFGEKYRQGMFVRFRKLLTKKKVAVLNLSLQRSYRDPGRLGQVCSETVAGLGSIRESPGPLESSEFWRSVDTRLPRLRLSGRLSANEELKIRRQIQAKIPRP